MSHKLKKKRKPNKESERQILTEIESTIYNGTDIGDNKGFEDSENYLQRRRAWLYSNLSLWDILIDCSDVMEDRDESGYPLSASSKRLASIISNIDELINRFKALLSETCCSSIEKDPENDSTATPNQDSLVDDTSTNDAVRLTANLAKMIDSENRKLKIANAAHISSEFQRCKMVMDTILDFFTAEEMGNRADVSSSEYVIPDMLKDENEHGIVNSLPSLSFKHGDEDLTTNSFNLWNLGETNEMVAIVSPNVQRQSEKVSFPSEMNMNDNLMAINSKKRMKRKLHKAGRPKGSKMKSPDSMVGRFRRLGYYPDYCVSEEVYKEAIEKGSPYCCPLCEKEYKERRSLEKHFAGTVNNKCPGVPVEKPTYKLENGRYYCTQPGCNHEVAMFGAKSMGVIWTHHQGEHLSKDANLPFSCDQCPKSFPLHSILASHIASTHELKKCSQICDVCGKTIAGSKNKIKQHMLVHTGEKIKCTQCDITFSRPGSLRRHMQHQHNTSRHQLYFCDVCGKGWKTRSVLNAHLESHKKEPEPEQQRQPPAQPDRTIAMAIYSQENG